MVQSHRFHASSLPGGSVLAETAGSLHGSARPSIRRRQSLDSIDTWQKPPGSHSKALSSHRLQPGGSGFPAPPQALRGHLPGAVAAGSPGVSAPPCMAEKGTWGAAPWLTAQEQSQYQQNWKALIQGVDSKPPRAQAALSPAQGSPSPPPTQDFPAASPLPNTVKANPMHTAVRCTRGARGEKRKNSSEKTHVLK